MRFEAPITRPRIAAESNPECSAMATPSMATNTVPKGAKPTKFFTKLVTISSNPSALSKLTTWIMPSAARPFAPSGRGSTTDSSKYPAIPEATSSTTQKMANNVMGWGNRFPKYSTPSRKRVIKGFLGAF
nr:Uncharacterised protein [Vibrio cholerae]CSC96764.1 Uncharacterised protein [Vibrio cholerae]